MVYMAVKSIAIENLLKMKRKNPVISRIPQKSPMKKSRPRKRKIGAIHA